MRIYLRCDDGGEMQIVLPGWIGERSNVHNSANLDSMKPVNTKSAGCDGEISDGAAFKRAVSNLNSWMSEPQR